MNELRINCPMRHPDNGNCTVAGGFCTAVSDPICEALHNAYDCGRRSIDPESLRPQGEWVLGVVEPGYFTPGGNRPWICSKCGKVISWMLDKPRENYCPNCGAKMKGAANNA